jgi:hypothetical protein
LRRPDPPSKESYRLYTVYDKETEKSGQGPKGCKARRRKNEVGLEVNAEKTKHILLSRHQNAGQNHDVKTADRRFKYVAQFRYFGTTVTRGDLSRVMLATIQSRTF